MDQSRRVFSNTLGNNGYIAQGDVINNHYVNNHAERQGEDDLLKRLYQSPYQDRKDRNPPKVLGTCDWFVSHEHFRAWNESNSSSMLWVSADPGCGKSVLVRHLVDSIIRTTESRTVCYFFFKDDFLDQKNVISALCCILRQIFTQKPSLLSDTILKKFNTGGETFNASFSELWQILIQVAEDKNAGEIVCLLDAIDECEDQSDQGRSQLLKALCTLYGTRKSFNLKFLLTSRPYVEIHRGLQPLQIPGLPVIHLSGESEDEMKKISQEINTYINARVQDIGKTLQLTQSERDLLLQRIMHVPNRTYLWVYLILDLIEKSINVNKMMIVAATTNIPTTIDKAYERILSKSVNTAQAKKALHLIVAAARPLTLREMSFALALNESHQSYDDLSLLPDDRFRENLRNICGLCVMIVDSKIYLLHQTVKEFLVKRDMDKMQTSGNNCGDYEWKYSLQPQESHYILAKVCIWHLLAGSKLKHESLSWHSWYDAFLDYSAKHWASHFREIPAEAQSMLTESVLKICEVDSSCCQRWFTLYWTTTNTEFPEGFTTLMMASYFGFNLAVQSLLDRDEKKLNAQDDTYHRSALSWAARNGFHIVSKLLVKGIRLKLGIFELPLIRRRAKIDLQDKYGRTPLTYAVWNGDIALVKMLTKAGARVDLQDELQGTPLSYAFCSGNDHIIDLLAKKRRQVDIDNDITGLLLSAAEKGHEEVMRLLLETDRADIEVKNKFGETALTVAARECHQAIVKLLLEAGADVNAQSLNGTPLIEACQGGHEAIVKLLLKAGADVNARNRYARNRYNSTALIEASQGGHEATVKLLLEAGADIDARTRYARNRYNSTALIEASQGGHEAIVQLLLKAGADVNARNRYARTRYNNTALIEASQGGHEATVKLLLEAGADIDARTRDNNTALIEASRGGHETIMKLLIKAGADANARHRYNNTAL